MGNSESDRELTEKLRQYEEMLQQYEEKRRQSTKTESTHFLAIRTVMLMALVLGIIAIVFPFIDLQLFREMRIITKVTVLVLIVGFGMTISLIYLHPNATPRWLRSASASRRYESFLARQSDILEDKTRGIEKRIARLSKLIQIKEGDAAAISVQDKREILASIQGKLESEALEQYKGELVNRIESEYELHTHDTVFERTTGRLDEEIRNQAKRGNYNLVLGCATTLVGVGVLGYAVFNAPKVNGLLQWASHFVPRLSLVLTIEIFAFFFLQLYKQSLKEIKYFQNELTNVEIMYLGVKLASGGDPKLLTYAVKSLVGTERNFVLEKGQSTVDIEKEKIEEQSWEKFTAVLDALVGKEK